MRQELSSRRSTARSIAKESSIVFSFVRGGCFFLNWCNILFMRYSDHPPAVPSPPKKNYANSFLFFLFSFSLPG